MCCSAVRALRVVNMLYASHHKHRQDHTELPALHRVGLDLDSFLSYESSKLRRGMTFLLECFDTVGWLVTPAAIHKASPLEDMWRSQPDLEQSP